MKEERKLQTAVSDLNDVITSFNANGAITQSDICSLIQTRDLIKEFLVDNTTTNSPKSINIWNFVSTDQLYPIMCGVCHDHAEKMAVACNCKALFASPELYDENAIIPADEIEKVKSYMKDADKYIEECSKKVVLDKYGNWIEGRYPKWQSVIPSHTTPFENMPTEAELMDSIKLAQTEYKLRKTKRAGTFDTSTFIKFKTNDGRAIGIKTKYVKYMMAFGLDGWCYSDTMIIKRNSKGETLLFMAVYTDDTQIALSGNVYISDPADIAA